MKVFGSASRSTTLALTVLLALLLPWQSFASIEHCDLMSKQSTITTHAGHEHCTEHPSPKQPHHGCCADCCLSAAVTAAIDWHLPRPSAPDLFLRVPHAPLTISLDRLDRPPRRNA